MRLAKMILGLAVALLLGSATLANAADRSKTFFNGKDLAGWEGLEEYWSVKDGTLVGHTPEVLKFNTFLCSKHKYTDFELKFQVQLKNGVGNSGVQIRSEVFDPKHFAVKGPQCDIGAGYWGSLYGEHFGGMMKAAPKEVLAKVVKNDGFNDYYIKCVGKHVTIKINDAVTVDDDFPTMPETGIIAWQLHQGFLMTVTFRNIQFTDLSSGKRE